MAGVQQITLERDGHDQPWGFRLQGGHDVGIPLSIQRVLVGTPAEGVLKKGDIIIKIGNTDAKALGHQQAADLFTNTGNQIQISIKRPGGSGLQTAHIVNASPAIAPPHNVPVTGGIALPGLGTVSAGKNPEALLTNLPKSRMAPSHQPLTTSTSAPLTIQNQPYRTSPLIQPSVKIDIGPGSAQHLKMQADHITGAKEALLSPDSQHSRAAEFSMQQKVTGSLQQIQHRQTTPPVQNFSEPIVRPAPVVNNPKSPVPMSAPVKGQGKQVYNTPINLYSSENIAEVARMNMMGGGTDGHTSPTGLIHPVNKPTKHFMFRGALPKNYIPEQSATWQAIHELEKCQLVTEHGPTESKVYSV